MTSSSSQLRRTIGLPSASRSTVGRAGQRRARPAGGGRGDRRPASIVAWAALCPLSFPLALTFGALARRQPVAGGFAASIERGLGRRWGRIALAACVGGPGVCGGQFVWRVAVMLAAVIYAVCAERSKARFAKDQLDSFTP